MSARRNFRGEKKIFVPLPGGKDQLDLEVQFLRYFHVRTSEMRTAPAVGVEGAWRDRQRSLYSGFAAQGKSCTVWPLCF